jgi:D-alanine-D-alanine ligase
MEGRLQYQACDVLLLVDAETGTLNRRGRFVPTRGSVEAHIFRELRRQGQRVAVLAFGADLMATIRALQQLAPRVVFNLTEWIDGERRLDYAIANLLELMELSYTGSGPRGLQLCRDKTLCKRIVAGLGVAVPREFRLTRRTQYKRWPFPLFVKPRFGDGSEAISKASLVKSALELRQRVSLLRRRQAAPILCEEFVPGRDLYVGLVGAVPRVLRPIEMVVGNTTHAAPSFATDRVKFDRDYCAKWEISFRHAKLDRDVSQSLRHTAVEIFQALELRDYARLDFRLTPDNRLVFLEANPNPDLAPHCFGAGLSFAGIPYATLLQRILASARQRSHLER